jgi:hypothetical protein
MSWLDAVPYVLKEESLGRARLPSAHLRARRREGYLPRYYFTVLWSNHEDIDPQGTLLADDAAALGHACRMVRRLLASGDYDDPGLVVEVRNEMRQRVLSIPFLAGCA